MGRRRNNYTPPADPVYSPEEIDRMKATIMGMGQYEMASLQRFAKSGHPYFRSDLPLYEVFKARFAAVGGMTPEISKDLGWGN